MRKQNEAPPLHGAIFFGLFGIVLLMGSVFAFGLFRKQTRTEQGEIVKGRITKIVREPGLDERKRGWHVDYRYQFGHGTQTGSVRLSPGDGTALKPGRQIEVRLSSAGPSLVGYGTGGAGSTGATHESFLIFLMVAGAAAMCLSISAWYFREWRRTGSK